VIFSRRLLFYVLYRFKIMLLQIVITCEPIKILLTKPLWRHKVVDNIKYLILEY